MKTTVVTALYDIGREKYDGRKLSDYLDWFRTTLSLNVPMVIFCQTGLGSFIQHCRKNYPETVIVETSVSSIPYFSYKDQIEKILNNNEYKKRIKDPTRIECNLALYNIIQYSKFEWLKKVSIFNPFNSKYFFWMDAGCSRFFDNVDVSKPWPSNYKILRNDQLNIQGNSNTMKYVLNWPGDAQYIMDSNCILVGTLFGGTANICQDMASRVFNEYHDWSKYDLVNNEQIMLGILYHRYHEFFNTFIKLDGTHLPFFKELSKE